MIQNDFQLDDGIIKIAIRNEIKEIQQLLDKRCPGCKVRAIMNKNFKLIFRLLDRKEESHEYRSLKDMYATALKFKYHMKNPDLNSILIAMNVLPDNIMNEIFKIADQQIETRINNSIDGQWLRGRSV